MRQHFSHNPARQLPHISGPDSLHLKTLYYLADNCLYPITDAAQPTTPLWIRIKASLLVGYKHLNALLAQMLCQLRLPVVTICKAVAFCLGDNFFNNRQVTLVSRGHKDASYHPRPAHSNVKAKAVEGLLYRVILAVVSLTSKASTFLGASKLANSYRKAIYDGKARVTVGLPDHALPKSLFQLPEISCLSNKSGAMKRGQSREEVRVVASEVIEDSLVLAQPKILANDFHSEDFTIREARLRPTGTETALAKVGIKSIVNEAKHSYNEGIQVQGERPPIVGLAITIENASPWTFNFNLKTCTSR